MESNNTQEEQAENEEPLIIKKPRLTQIRETVSPYLPPPLLKAMDRVDPQLEPYIGPEASITILGTLVFAWIVFMFLRLVSSRRTGRAIADEDDDHVLSTTSMPQEEFSETVLLCGPRGAGKTRLFYQLCFEQSNMPTVQSIKANVGIVHGIRYMDWPGYASLTDAVLVPVLQSKPRIVLVLDATQPVAAAADTLDQLLSYYSAQQQAERIPIFVACHKNDLPKAKNWRRVKIQLRTELERLLKIKTSDQWWPAGEPLEMDELPFCQLHFVSTTCENKNGTSELGAFCQTGQLPEAESS